MVRACLSFRPCPIALCRGERAPCRLDNLPFAKMLTHVSVDYLPLLHNIIEANSVKRTRTFHHRCQVQL